MSESEAGVDAVFSVIGRLADTEAMAACARLLLTASHRENAAQLRWSTLFFCHGRGADDILYSLSLRPGTRGLWFVRRAKMVVRSLGVNRSPQ